MASLSSPLLRQNLRRGAGEIGILLPNNLASTALCTSRRMCCPTHCASCWAPCQPLLRAFSGWIRCPRRTSVVWEGACMASTHSFAQRLLPPPIADDLTGVLRSQNNAPPLGPPSGSRHRTTGGSQGWGASYERGTPGEGLGRGKGVQETSRLCVQEPDHPHFENLRPPFLNRFDNWFMNAALSFS